MQGLGLSPRIVYKLPEGRSAPPLLSSGAWYSAWHSEGTPDMFAERMGEREWGHPPRRGIQEKVVSQSGLRWVWMHKAADIRI